MAVTCVNKTSRRSFTELFGLVGQRDLDDPGDVTGRSLDPDSMRGDQLQTDRHMTVMITGRVAVLIIGKRSAVCYLAPHQHGAEDDLQAVKEVVSDQDDGRSARRPALTGTDGFDTGSGCWTRDTETGRERETGECQCLVT